MSTLTLAVLLLFVAVALGVWAVLTDAEEKATVKASLRALDDYEAADVRAKELQAPLVQRIFKPVGDSLVAVGRRFMPGGYMEGVRKRLIIAGKPSPRTSTASGRSGCCRRRRSGDVGRSH